MVQGRVTEEVLLDPSINRTGNVWHVFLTGDLHNMLYGYRFDGAFAPQSGQYLDASNIVVDPYAKVLMTRQLFLLCSVLFTSLIGAY
jgi:isoamylase